MKTKLKVNGMHCEACKTLLSMEMDDLGISEYRYKFKLEPKENYGLIYLTDVDEEKVALIKKAINSYEGYSVE